MNIITPIRPQDFEEFIFLVNAINKRANIIEVWLDQAWDKKRFFTQLAHFIKENK